ncbi:MAG: hypothetical protein GX148_08760 [Clostridiales bacterium]|jgi:hypothetical protein|nr:hypothetical protein [Clostridiales bacterium]
MKISANKIFENALGLMGLINEEGKASGIAGTLRKNAIACINASITELTGINRTVTGLPITPARIISLADYIECDDYIGSLLFPLSLAGRLSVRIDNELSVYFRAEYLEGLRNIKTNRKAQSLPIEEVYH